MAEPPEAGCESEAGFSRAFRRADGVLPATWSRGRGPEDAA